MTSLANIIARRETLALQQRLTLAHVATRPVPCYAGPPALLRNLPRGQV